MADSSKPTDDKKPTSDKIADAPPPADPTPVGKTPPKEDKKTVTPSVAGSTGAAPAPSTVKSTESAKDSSKEKETDTKPKTSSVPGAGSNKPAASTTSTSSDTKPKPMPGEKKSSSGGGFVLKGILAVAILGGAAFVTKDVWLPSVQPYLAQVPGLQGGAPAATAPSALDALATRLDSLEQQVASSTGDSQAMAALRAQNDELRASLEASLARIEDLEGRLTEVRELAQTLTAPSGEVEIDLAPILNRLDAIETANRRASAEVAALGERVETELSAPTSAGDASASAMVLAIAQLRDAAFSGQPYAAQLDALRVLAAGNDTMTAATVRLSDAAVTGLPTVAELTDGFGEIAGDIVAISRTSGGDWLDQAAGRLSTLVSVRRTDGQSGDPIEDAVATIEQHLAANDVGAAVETASALSNTLATEPRSLLEPWLLDAALRAEAETVLNTLHTSALAGLGQ